MKFKLLLLLLWAFAYARPVWAVIGSDQLSQNGAQFILGDKRFPLRCLDSPDLLNQSSSRQAAVLKRAAEAGFNAVSFEAPLFGPGAFFTDIGKTDEEAVGRFRKLLDEAAKKDLFLFPVLWSPETARLLVKRIGGDMRHFWGYKIHMQWQAWMLHTMGKKSGASGHKGVGGWLLWRGAWPGPYPEGALQSANALTGTAKMKFAQTLGRWSAWQVRTARRAGLSQPTGLGFWFVSDLPKVRLQGSDGGDEERVDGDSAAPLPDFLDAEPELIDVASADVLPPVPGEEKIVDSDGEQVYNAAAAQIEWEAFSEAYKSIPLPSGLDFMEVTFDTQDWHRVADRFAEVAARTLEVPLLWRHDWRGPSRNERETRLEVDGLAGLSGPWPDTDWPQPRERIWPDLDLDPTSGKNQALRFQEISVGKRDGVFELVCRLNRPSELKASWGKQMPLGQSLANRDKALVHRVPLSGALEGDKVLVTVRANSDRWGRAVMRTRWIRVAEKK